MCADDGANVRCHDICGWELGANGLFQHMCPLGTIPVSHHHGAAQLRHPALLHTGQLGFDGLLSPSGLLHHRQPSRFVHMKEGLDLKGCPENSCGSRHPTAPPQMVKHIHCEPVADLQTGLRYPLGQLLQRIPRRLPPGCFPDQEALAH